MIASDLYTKLKKLNVIIRLVDDRLDLQAPKNVLNAELLNEIKENKEALIELLISYKKSNKKYSHIEQVDINENYLLSSGQQRLWILSQFEESNAAYNMPGVFIFTGDLKIQDLKLAFYTLIERHEILRTIFKQNEHDEIRQFILQPQDTNFNLIYKDLTKEDNQSTLVDQLVKSVFSLPFNLEQGPLLRAEVYQVEKSKFIFCYAMHHIISDGWSMGILIKELLYLYNGIINSNLVPLEPLRIQYKDYSAWQQKQLNGKLLQEHQSYWLNQFEGELPIFDLISSKVRPKIQTFNGGIINKTIDKQTTLVLKKIIQDQGATLFMGLLAAINTLIYRYNNQEDIIIGSPIAGRDHADLQNQIGFYVNTLALRTRFKGTDSFSDLLNNIKKITLDAYQHQVYPFDELVEALNLNRDMSRNPLFDVMLVLEHNEQNEKTEQHMENLSINHYDNDIEIISKFDFTFNFNDFGEYLTFGLEYNSTIYQHHFVEQMAQHLCAIIKAVVANPSIEIEKIEYLSNDEKQILIQTFNNTSVDYPYDKTIIDLFEEQVEKTPKNVAIVFEDTNINYHKLNEISNQFANYLLKNYLIKPNDLIAIELDRSDWNIISFLAVLKSGGAYVPIDSLYPKDRKEYMLNDSQCKLVINEDEVKKFNLIAKDYSVKNIKLKINPQDLAYVIYTSGTTGQPKGVMIQHNSLFDYTNTFLATFKVDENDRCIQQSSFSFDTHIEEIYPVLTKGGAILMGKNGGQDIDELKTLIEEKGATILTTTPLVLRELNSININLFKLRLIISGGDEFNTSYISNFLNKVDIYDSYGPTESTVCSTYHKIESLYTSSIIGKPINNRNIFILNNQNQPVPIATVGEICIGGSGLARGYLNRPELTAEKFVSNPFRKEERIYKTGDLGCWLPDGNIQFLGRIDNQVKIRGYRIELGEIESALEKHPAIQAATVIVQNTSDNQKELVAYFVANQPLEVTELRSFLSESLPSYMMPAQWIKIDEMPLTSNGKLDRKKLSEINSLTLASNTEYILPRNETEQKLLEIWENVLKKDNISVKDNFFELGGHSINATRLAMQIQKNFNKKLDLKDIFTYSVLEEQAIQIQQKVMVVYSNIPLSPIATDYPLTAAQRRIWILCQFEEANAAYNMPGVYVFNGDLNSKALKTAFDLLIERHEILRTVFKQNEQEEIRQFILSTQEIAFNLTYIDLRKETNQASILDELVQNVFSLPFNLEKGPLLRAEVYQVEKSKFIFSYAMHHIISDGWSMGILIKELLYLYNGVINFNPVPLEPLRIQYKDYGAWQEDELSGESLQHHQLYWLKQFEGELPIFELTPTIVRPIIQTFKGGVISKTINEQTSIEFKKIIQDQGATLFIGLLAVVNTLIHRYNNQEDIIIGSPITGREHADLENQIGFYVNTLALRTRFKGTDSFLDLINKVKEVTLEAYNHQIYPFDELVDSLRLQRDMSRNPLFDVMITLEHNEVNQNKEHLFKDLTVTQYEGITDVISKFDLTFNFEDTDANLSFSLVYNSDIYQQQLVSQLADHLVSLMDAIVQSPTTKIGQLNYLKVSERTQLITIFNDSAVASNTTKNVIDLFEEQVIKTPNALVLVFEEVQLTYGELNEKSNQLANYLINNHTIHSEDLIAIKLERSDWLIISILATLKTGAAYVPIDPSLPDDRVDFMLDDCQCNFIIDSTVLKKFTLEQANYKVKNLNTTIKSNNLAYVIYTSGSTGKPKGVMVEHQSLINLCYWHKDNYELTEQDRSSVYAGVGFDAFVWEVFPSLISGASIFIVPNEIRLDITEIAKYFDENKITIGFLPTQIAEQFFETKNNSLRYLLVGGDKLHKFNNQNYQIVNNYGPTENTVVTTCIKLDQNFANIPIGKPISNVIIYILDNRGNIVPIGVPGEICIGGSGLARGYLNRPDLTAEKFVSNPFREGERMYKTGDLGCWLPDGNILFLGRNDDQVKIRGYRIELGEIESALEKHPAIQAVTVIVQNTSDNQKELVAYFVANQPLEVTELRSFLSESLPSYMMPAQWIKIDEMPLTPNGKLDRKKLSEINSLTLASNTEYILPRNEMEYKLHLIWKKILEKDEISVKDNFFELGGNSLKALKMHSAIKKNINSQLKIQDIYHYPTIEKLAKGRTENTGLLKLQSTQKKPAKSIYFIPPVIGNSILYKPLTDTLENGFNCYGFQYPGLDSDEPLFESIEKAAVFFSDQLISNNKNDHLILVGYSMGGNIAFEMAKILETNNFSLTIVLIDSVVKTTSESVYDLNYNINETDWLIEQYKNFIGEDGVNEENLKIFLNNNFKIFNNYKQKDKIKSPIHLFEAKENKIPTNMKKWHNYTNSKTTHKFIEGGHWDAMNKENLHQFKEVIMQL